MQNSSLKCSIVGNDGELMLTALHTLSATAAVFSDVRTVFGFSRFGLSMTHDFQSNVVIFPSVVQAYTQPYLFGGWIKLIICQIRHELSVTIYEKNVKWRTQLIAQWLLKDALYVYPFLSPRFVLIYSFFVTQ